MLAIPLSYAGGGRSFFSGSYDQYRPLIVDGTKGPDTGCSLSLSADPILPFPFFPLAPPLKERRNFDYLFSLTSYPSGEPKASARAPLPLQPQTLVARSVSVLFSADLKAAFVPPPFSHPV